MVGAGKLGDEAENAGEGKLGVGKLGAGVGKLGVRAGEGKLGVGKLGLGAGKPEVGGENPAGKLGAVGPGEGKFQKGNGLSCSHTLANKAFHLHKNGVLCWVTSMMDDWFASRHFKPPKNRGH